MFEPQSSPRVFGVPPGADFPQILVSQVRDYYQNRPPEELARVRTLVNTRRMQRRLRDLFCRSGPLLLPRIALVADFDSLLPGAALPEAISPLRRRLEMTRLVAQRIESDRYAPKSAAVDLAESLSSLLDEMQGQGVSPEALSAIQIEDESGYWERSLAFLNVVNTYVKAVSERGVDGEARRRTAAELLIQHWAEVPPPDPVIIAGSTGSRGTTSMLMEAVARLPNGAVVLPGFDFDLRNDVWDDLAHSRQLEDHPQYRFAAFLSKLDLSPSAVTPLGEAPDVGRNKLISLSLRPAKVTDQWLSEGPQLGNLYLQTKGLTLIEAAQPREEALAIAVALKEAVHQGKKVALITPDGTLGRRVAATLARWLIRPDESAGVPLSLTPPGRFLRQIANMIGSPVAPDALLALLKHPLCRTGSDDRGTHLLNTTIFEVACRSNYVAEISHAMLDDFAGDDEDRKAWCDWLAGLVSKVSQAPEPNLEACLTRHIELAEALSSGAEDGSGLLWEKEDGADVLAQVESFRLEADFPAQITFAEYARLLERALMSESSRIHEGVRSDVMIWGTLEARVQGADLVILAGLNEGIWPEQPAPDPWLNRRMRRELGLLLPEREIGLSAHDYQQAVAAKEVILSRAKRNDESETVPSRWVNRLINLLKGLEGNHGPAALEEMQARGGRFIEIASTLDPAENAKPAKRPAPAPPVVVRPTQYSVTGIRTLVRDPYAIYAQHILRLRPLSPLIPQPDARLRGIVFHTIMEDLFRPEAEAVTVEDIRDAAKVHLNKLVPWSHARAHWMGHLEEIADSILSFQAQWREAGTVIKAEAKGLYEIRQTPFSVVAKADRIDAAVDGSLLIYDYKTGGVPTKKDIKTFDRQLLIEALMAEAGAFDGLPAAPVTEVTHVGIGRSPLQSSLKLGKDYETVSIADELAELLTSYHREGCGYISRRIMENVRFDGDYDHLARFGEWDATSPSASERVS